MAIALVEDRRYRAFRTMDALPLYEELIVGGAWWDYVDAVAAGPLGELLPEVAPALRAWAIDADMWKRRSAIIAQVRRKRDDGLRAADRLHRAQPRRPRVLHPQGDRLGAALLRVGRAGRGGRVLRHARAEPVEPAGGAQERGNLVGMPDYTKLNLREVEDAAKKFGMPPGLESRFARDALGLKNQGMTLFTLAPGYRIPFGHRHGEQEEVYVIVAGSARVKLEDEIVELATWDALRIPPEVRRGVEAGPDGAELLAVGAPNVGFGDAEQLPDFWPA